MSVLLAVFYWPLIIWGAAIAVMAVTCIGFLIADALGIYPLPRRPAQPAPFDWDDLPR